MPTITVTDAPVRFPFTSRSLPTKTTAATSGHPVVLDPAVVRASPARSKIAGMAAAWASNRQPQR